MTDNRPPLPIWIDNYRSWAQHYGPGRFYNILGRAVDEYTAIMRQLYLDLERQLQQCLPDSLVEAKWYEEPFVMIDNHYRIYLASNYRILYEEDGKENVEHFETFLEMEEFLLEDQLDMIQSKL